MMKLLSVGFLVLSVCSAHAVECVDIKSKNLKGPKVCVGDEIGVVLMESQYSSSIKQFLKTKIQEIDTAANDLSKSEPIYFLTKNGEAAPVRFTSEQIILTNKDYCFSSAINEVCVGEVYPDSYGNVRKVIGYKLPKEEGFTPSLTVQMRNNVAEYDLKGDTNTDVYVHKTGIVEKFGSCSENPFLPTFDSTIKKCAAKKAIESLVDACNKLTPSRNGMIEIEKTQKELQELATCSDNYYLFGGSETSCSVAAKGLCKSRIILRAQ